MASVQGRLTAAVASVVLSTVLVSAQQTTRPATARHSSARQNAKTAAGPIRSLINGFAVNGDRTPVPHVSVRLRNLALNVVEQTLTTNEAGEFTFTACPDIVYIVEAADSAGRTIAVSDVVLARAGEVAGAIVLLPAELPPLATVFTDTASAVITAAARIGIGVVDPSLPKVSPTR